MKKLIGLLAIVALLVAASPAPAAVLAFVTVYDSVTNGSDNTLVDVQVHINILGGDTGDVGAANYYLIIEGLDPTTVSLVNTGISDAVKADMQGHGITFGMTDTVVVR